MVKGAICRPGLEQLREIRLAGDRARSQAFDEARREAAAADALAERKDGTRDEEDRGDIHMQIETETGTVD